MWNEIRILVSNSFGLTYILLKYFYTFGPLNLWTFGPLTFGPLNTFGRLLLDFFNELSWFFQWTKLKRDSSSGDFLLILRFFYETLLDDSLLLDFFIMTRNQVFSVFEHVSLRLLSVMNIMDFTIKKLYFAKLTRVFF